MDGELINSNRNEIPRVYLLAVSAIINGLLLTAIIYLLGERHVQFHFPGSATERIQQRGR
jgi:hypothetical protein